MRRNPRLVLLGQKVRSARESKGFSQEAFANEVGLDRSYYGGVERGERNVAALNLMRIGEALRVDPGDLVPSLHDLKVRHR